MRQLGEWRERAACRGLDTELFFPPIGKSAAPALEICATCPVTEPCLEYGQLVGKDGGVWGGMVSKQRRTRRGQEAHG